MEIKTKTLVFILGLPCDNEITNAKCIGLPH